MQKIPIFLAKPGMRLASEVKDGQGRVLCASGVDLDQELIERFKRLGVKFIRVNGRPIQFPWDRPLEEELKLLEERFAHVKEDKVLQMLKDVIRNYWLKTRGDQSV